ETAHAAALRALSRAVEGLGLSARAFERCLRVARTIADLDGSEAIASDHIDEAVAYRLAPAVPVG
ncbi:MAG: ATP-binding protein, partial [Actinobacteria bacterium]|nr:ATP-binding protein [Actinomycetota bacterium]